MKIKAKKLTETALLPSYATPGDAGADLFADEDVLIFGRQQKLVRTGIALEIPKGFVGIIRPRSGLATKLGLGMNSSGVIDSGYRGEIMVNLINHSDVAVEVKRWSRIAQLLIQAVETVKFEEADELSESVRGTSGHGSTGS